LYQNWATWRSMSLPNLHMTRCQVLDVLGKCQRRSRRWSIDHLFSQSICICKNQRLKYNIQTVTKIICRWGLGVET
jgi:hypothetical protein